MNSHMQSIRQAKRDRQLNSVFVWVLTLLGLTGLFVSLILVLNHNDQDARQNVANPAKENYLLLTPKPKYERAAEQSGDFVP